MLRVSGGTCALTGDVLFVSFRGGLRNGNWKKLKERRRYFFNAALFYLRRGGRIVSMLVLEKLRLLMEKLNETIGISHLRTLNDLRIMRGDKNVGRFSL